MGYTPKDWRNATTHEGGGDETTPISAVALEDLETRVTDYTDIHGAAVSVMDSAFGVTGDGVTDDTVGFESARTAAGIGGHIYVPPNTYIVNDVTLDVDHQTWTFAPGAIIKLKDSAGGELCAFEIRGDYLTLDGGEWDGNRANNANINTGVIQIRGGAHSRIRNIYLHDAQYYGVRAFPSATDAALDDLEVSHSLFSDCIAAGVFFDYGAVGAPTTPSRGARITSCHFDNSAVAAASITGAGFSIYGHTGTTANMPRGCVIADCFVRSRTDAVTQCSGIGLTQVVGGEISDCYTESLSFEGIVVLGENITVVNCVDRGSVTYGFEIIDLVGSVLSGCISNGDAVTETGITLNGVTDAIVSGCLVHNMKTTGTVTALSFANTVTRATVTGCELRSSDRAIDIGGDTKTDLVIVGNLVVGDTAAWGLIGQSCTTGSKRWLIKDNQFLDCASGAIYLEGSSVTVSDVTIQGNAFTGNTGDPLQVSTLTFDNTCRPEIWGIDSVASGASITLPFVECMTVTGTADITSITASYPGREAKLIFSGTAATNGLVDGSNLKLASTLAYTPDDTITLVCDGTNWYETGRSVN